MKNTATPRVASKEFYSSLTRLHVYVFVDGSDLGLTLTDVESLDYVSENLDRSIRRLTHHCRNFGHIQEAYVFDDDWHPIQKSIWTQENYTTISVEKEGLDSRVSQVLSLRAFQTAVRLSGNAIFAFIVGAANYQELIEEIKYRGFKVVLIGIDDYQVDLVKQMVDIWVPFQRAVPDVKPRKGTGISGYDWTDFVVLVNSLEKSNLDFVGVNHLIRRVLPSIGLHDVSQAHILVEQAEAKGIIKMYKVQNPNGPYPVQACRLVGTNDVVKGVLHKEEVDHEER